MIYPETVMAPIYAWFMNDVSWNSEAQIFAWFMNDVSWNKWPIYAWFMNDVSWNSKDIHLIIGHGYSQRSSAN